MRRAFSWIAVFSLLSPSARAQSFNSTLAKNCGRPGYACGECETSLQEDFNRLLAKYADVRTSGGHWSELKGKVGLKPGADMDAFLKEATELFRKHNPKGNGQLNYMIIGHSESLQGTTPRNPRIALKSPDGEFWLTFNTDPAAPGYNAVEVMRWDGKNAKYQFQEVSFPDGKGGEGHADFTSQKCARCHRDPMRPNWDTYRSWSNVIPPRDDLAERGADGKPDLAGRAYLDFMQQIADAKRTPQGRDSRLALLDIPAAGATDADKVAAIRQQIETQGFFRVPHAPEKENLLNFSQKTAPKAGSSHLGFDQMMGQVSCQISTDLKRHPNFDKFKYALTGLIKCAPVERKGGAWSDYEAYFPDSFKKAASGYFTRSDSLNLPRGKVPVRGETMADTLSAILDHTKRSYDYVDESKTGRARRWLSDWGRAIGAPNVDAGAVDVTTKQTGVSYPFTAIADPGGVKSVAESDPGIVSALRYVLEPLGVKVGSWSMVHAKNIGDPTYSFSDQLYDMLREQPMYNEIMASIPGSTHGEKCEKLRELSKRALDGEGSFGIEGGNGYIRSLCQESPGITQEQLAEKIHSEIGSKTCMACHSVMHPEVERFFGKSEETRNFLRSPYNSSMDWEGKIRQMLTEDRMPPGGFNLGSTEAERLKNDRDRREALLQYMDYRKNGASSAGLKCDAAPGSSTAPSQSSPSAKGGVQ